MRKPLLAAALILSAFSPGAKAAERWIRLTTPHFEMYTTNSEKQGVAALKVFEQVRYFFLQNSHSKSAPNTPVRIVAFRSEKEFKPYRANEGAFAYYLRSRKNDYIVMQDISPEHYQSAVHEYTHLIIEHLDLKLPIWFNEGLADLYSSLEPKGNQALVGRPLEGRAEVLMSQRWLDWNTLFAVGPESPYYNERDKMSIFYAQSWALTHMLALGNSYMPAFPKFLAAVAAGRPVSDCLQSVYGKSLAQLTQDLHAYLNQFSVQGALYDVKLGKTDLNPDASEPSELDVDLTLANLLASQKKTSGEASQRLAKIASDHPENAEAQESLGYLAWAQGNPAHARECFKLAIEKGSKNPEMLFHYAQLSQDSGASADQVLPLLQSAVAAAPDRPDAWLNLGMTAVNAHKYGVALDAFSHLKSVKPDRAYDLFSAQAYCYLQLKSPDQARALAEKAKQYAGTPDQILQASNLLRHLDSIEQEPVKRKAVERNSGVQNSPGTPTPTPPVAQTPKRDLPRDVPSIHRPDNLGHVEAVVKSFECSSQAHRLHVTVDSREMVFEFDDPERVVVRNAKSGSFDMQCGAQKPFKLGIFYIPPTPRGSADGVIRELVF